MLRGSLLLSATARRSVLASLRATRLGAPLPPSCGLLKPSSVLWTESSNSASASSWSRLYSASSSAWSAASSESTVSDSVGSSRRATTSSSSGSGTVPYGRTHYCGADLSHLISSSASSASSSVQLSGWLRHRRQLNPTFAFAVLADGHGQTQVVYNPQIHTALQSAPLESQIRVIGNVSARPLDATNSTMSSGNYEVHVSECTLLNEARDLPFFLHKADQVAEEVRLRYRHLDLRRPQLQHNLRLRARVYESMRSVLFERGFVDVETPTLFRSTPEGAREFLVPTRQKDRFYALTQSPQQYKQLLMAGGFDRYYQFARCYRDEGHRADRQPEFTQLDLEMSHVEEENIYELIECLLVEAFAAAGHTLPTPFPRMTYAEAMLRYGVDKPDTRYEMCIEDLSTSDLASNATLFYESTVIRAFAAPALAEVLSKKKLQALLPKNTISLFGTSDGVQLSGSACKSLSTVQQTRLIQQFSVHQGDVLLLTHGTDEETVASTLGRLRIAVANELRAADRLVFCSDEPFRPLWVHDFPLFSRADHEEGEEYDGRTLDATHHPFTAPAPEDAHRLLSDPLSVRGRHYDCVLNGVELGGGSIRIHQADVQLSVLRDVLGLPESRLHSFSHLLTALASGCPPHGGIALGMDRLIAVMCGASSLREVIAFPKTSSGNELLSGAPAEVTSAQKLEYHLR